MTQSTALKHWPGLLLFFSYRKSLMPEVKTKVHEHDLLPQTYFLKLLVTLTFNGNNESLCVYFFYCCDFNITKALCCRPPLAHWLSGPFV